MNQPSNKMDQQVIAAFKMLKSTPDGEVIMQWLQGLFLYPNPQIAEWCGGKEPSNDELLGHHRVVLHMLTMMDQ